MPGFFPPVEFPQLQGRPGTPGPAGAPGAAGAQGPAGPAGAAGNAESVSVDVVDVMGMATNNGKDIVAGVAGQVILVLSAVLSTIGTNGTNTQNPQISIRYAGSVSLAVISDMPTLAASSAGTAVVRGTAGPGTSLPSVAVAGALRAVNSSNALNGTWTGTARLTVYFQRCQAS